jgi:MFS family permease
MAAVTAAYAIGSVVFSLLLARLVEQVSLAAALATMGAIIFLCGLFSAAVLQGSRASYNSNTATPPVPDSRIPAISSVVLLWLAYGCSVFAGLMAIGHAAGIVDALGGRYTVAVWGAVFVGIGSAAGGFFAGAVIGRNNMDRLLVGLPMASALFLGVLAISTGPYMAIAGLSLVGFCYGALIAVYPFAVSELYGHNQGPKIYGRVFTAWGFSGLVGPWFAGILYDQSGDYTVALGVACAISLVSPAVYLLIMRQQPGYLARHRLHT